MGSIAWIFMFTIMGLLLITTFVDTQFSKSSLLHKLDEDKLRDTKESTSNDLDLDHDLLTSNIGIEKALKSILNRYKERLGERMGPRMMDGDSSMSNRRITEICGISASLECGEKVLKASLMGLDAARQDENDFRARCDLREKFLECIDNQRYSCGKLAREGVFPILPPKKDIQGVQEKVWKSLWTSGGCILGI